MKTKFYTQHHAIYTLVFLLMIVSFVPVSSHIICGFCPWDGSGGLDSSPGVNGQCQVCNFNHDDHIYEPPPPPPPTTQAECDEAREECEKAEEKADEAWEQAALVCGVALLEPSPAGELACSVFTVRAMAKTTYASYVCEKADDICSQVDSTPDCDECTDGNPECPNASAH